MKRILWLMAALLLLCGCTTRLPEETATHAPQTVPQQTEAEAPAGIYEPFSDLEAQTDGTVRCFLPGNPDAYGMRLMNGDVLVFSGTEVTTLTRYTGDILTPAGQITLECWVSPEDTSFQISEHGITYYDPGANMLVYLDNDLKEVSRLELADDLMGKPVLSGDRTKIYYCTSDAVRVYDTASGLEKLIKSISYPMQSVESVLMGDTVLRCGLTDDQGRNQSIFLSTQDGQWIAECDGDLSLTTVGDRWIARTAEGILEQVLFGEENGPVQVLYPRDAFAEVWIMESNFSAVTASMDSEKTVLDYYDLETGFHSATVELPGTVEPWYMDGTPENDWVYILAHDEMAGGPVILRWDLSVLALLDDLTYTGPRYTAQSPDEAGLAECMARADAIGQKYGVNILVGPEAAGVQPPDYILEYEYQVSVLWRDLTVLEEALSQFPEGFFAQLHGRTNICILRSITGNAQTGSIARASGVQFWDGENAYAALEAGDSLLKSFFHEIFHIVDSKVLSTTRAYYRWENLNPEGFEYFEDVTSYLTADVDRYLENENRAFIDAYSMCYPREDRARIMEYACTEGNSYYFQSEIMQNKLKTLCEGIREAFGLEKYQKPLLWEQYLIEPLRIK